MGGSDGVYDVGGMVIKSQEVKLSEICYSSNNMRQYTS